MKLIYLILICLIAGASNSHAQSKSVETTQNCNTLKDSVSDSDYSYKIVSSMNNTWGYDIFKGTKRIIHQLNIPGLPGNEGFKTKSDAEKVAILVIKKLEKGEMPPTITKEELRNLNVL